MMTVAGRVLGGWAIGLAMALMNAPRAVATDQFERVDDVYSAGQLRHTPFDARIMSISVPEESKFLENVFALTDESILLNANVRLWFRTNGVQGLHAADYLARMDEVSGRLEALDAPSRVRSVRDLLAESFALQRRFVNDWYDALQAGRPFESQLTDEYAYHEGLHRSHRLLLKTFAELRALYPDERDSNHRAFHDLLLAVDFK